MKHFMNPVSTIRTRETGYSLSMTASANQHLEARSKVLFGNKHMLRLAAHVADCSAPFTVDDVANKTAVPYASAHRLVGHLVSAGLVDRAPEDPGVRFRWYSRSTHKFWDAVKDLCESGEDGAR